MSEPVKSIETLREDARQGVEQAQRDIQAAQQAHGEAVARLNYCKGAYEALAAASAVAVPPAN